VEARDGHGRGTAGLRGGAVAGAGGGYAQLREDIRDLREHVLHLDQKVDRFRGELSAQIAGLDDKLTRWLRWLVGILVTALLTQIGVLSAALFR